MEPALALIAALAIEIDAILSHFHLRQDEAEDLLREILLLAVHRWDGIDSREIWLLATIRRACLRQVARR
jgi:DNA-directed RNA polymerase specialized sigma24 family protein